MDRLSGILVVFESTMQVKSKRRGEAQEAISIPEPVDNSIGTRSIDALGDKWPYDTSDNARSTSTSTTAALLAICARGCVPASFESDCGGGDGNDSPPH